jgi:hypothetical protein
MSRATRILRGARKLLIEKGWTQGEFARDANGHPVFSNAFYEDSGRIACYCLTGAAFAVEPECCFTDEAFDLLTKAITGEKNPSSQ